MWTEPLSNGKFKFVERYEDPLTGEMKKVSITLDRDTTSSRKVAQATLADKIQAKLDKLSLTVKKDDLRLSDLVERYRKSQELSMRKSTCQRNYHAENVLLQILGESTLVSRLTASYIKDKIWAHDKKAGTYNEHIKRFKALIRWGYENELIDDIRYLERVKNMEDKKKKERLQDKYLESYELKKLLSAMTVQKWEYLAELTALSGMRCGEALALNRSDIDFKGKNINIDKNYDYVNDITTLPKTKCSDRDVFMQPELEILCRKIYAYYQMQQSNYGYQTDLFMSDINGDHLQYDAYNKYLREVSMRVLGRKVTTHIMRHTHVSLMAEAGVPLDIIARRLGHENSDITKRIYLHITERMKERDRERLQSVRLL